MPREIENAGRAFFFEDLDAFGAQPVGKERVAAAGIDRHVGAEFRHHAIALRLQAVDDERIAFAMREQSPHADIRDEFDAGQARRMAAHDELERGAAAEEERHVFVGGIGDIAVAQAPAAIRL